MPPLPVGTRFLTGEGSPAFVRELEGNGRAGRFVRAPKGDLPWVRRSATVGEPRLAPVAFGRTRTVDRHGCGTPARVRAAQLGQVPMAA